MWATKGKVHLDSSLDCWDLSEKGGNSTLPTWAAQLGGRLPAWHTDNTEPCSTLFDILLGQGKQYLLTVSLGSILGSCCFIAVVDRIQRRRFLTTSFIVLSVLFMITGGVYYGVNQRVGAPATVALVAICHFMFNFGKKPESEIDFCNA